MIKGKRLILRAPEPEDVDFILNMENNTDYWPVSETLFPYSRFEVESFILNSNHDLFSEKQLRLIIMEKEGNEPIGLLDLYDYHPLHQRAGVGIMLAKNEQAKGYASEALELLADFATKQLSLHQLYAYIHEDNEKSQKLFHKMGYQTVGLIQDWELRAQCFKHVFFVQKLLNVKP